MTAQAIAHRIKTQTWPPECQRLVDYVVDLLEDYVPWAELAIPMPGDRPWDALDLVRIAQMAATDGRPAVVGPLIATVGYAV